MLRDGAAVLGCVSYLLMQLGEQANSSLVKKTQFPG